MNNRSITAALSIVFVLFLSGCVGSGVKDVSQFLPLIDSQDESAVLIVRQTGFTGVGALVEVVVDGVVVGDLGNKEILAHKIPAGEHSVLVRFKGIGGLGLNKVMKTFTLGNGEKAYFQIGLKTGLLVNTLQLNGVTKDTLLYGGD